MKIATTSIMIDASADAVWKIITDFANYSAWNPGIRNAVGQLREGERVEIDMVMPGNKISPMKVTLTSVRPPHELGWVGDVWHPWLLRGRRRFRIVPLETGVRFEHSETFTGLLHYLLAGPVRAKIEQGFSAVNEALKERVEAVKAAAE